MLNKHSIIPILALLAVIALIFVGPISQDDAYHHFADQREMLSIPNFLNVSSNLPFILIAIWGISVSGKYMDKKLRNISYLLFVGFFLLTFGSGYYHLYPNNITLVYDRLPMSVIFMSFFSFLIYDRIDKQKGYIAFIVLNIVGIATVIYWALTEQAGKGDLRWYALVQYFPLIAIPLIIWLYKSPFNHGKYIVAIFVLFGLAKLGESYDDQIYEALNKVVSGHSIKHLFMAAAGYYIVKMMYKRTVEN
ncbi:MAG: putative rane protein [Daejeonella sp.]|nr:putative rane protein [Daejeonella sp.]